MAFECLINGLTWLFVLLIPLAMFLVFISDTAHPRYSPETPPPPEPYTLHLRGGADSRSPNRHHPVPSGQRNPARQRLRRRQETSSHIDRLMAQRHFRTVFEDRSDFDFQPGDEEEEYWREKRELSDENPQEVIDARRHSLLSPNQENAEGDSLQDKHERLEAPDLLSSPCKQEPISPDTNTDSTATRSPSANKVAQSVLGSPVFAPIISKSQHDEFKDENRPASRSGSRTERYHYSSTDSAWSSALLASASEARLNLHHLDAPTRKSPVSLRSDNEIRLVYPNDQTGELLDEPTSNSSPAIEKGPISSTNARVKSRHDGKVDTAWKCALEASTADAPHAAYLPGVPRWAAPVQLRVQVSERDHAGFLESDQGYANQIPGAEFHDRRTGRIDSSQVKTGTEKGARIQEGNDGEDAGESENWGEMNISNLDPDANPEAEPEPEPEPAQTLTSTTHRNKITIILPYTHRYDAERELLASDLPRSRSYEGTKRPHSDSRKIRPRIPTLPICIPDPVFAPMDVVSPSVRRQVQARAEASPLRLVERENDDGYDDGDDDGSDDPCWHDR